MIETRGDLASCGVIVSHPLSLVLLLRLTNIITSNKDYKTSGGGGRGCAATELGLDLN